MSANVRQQSTQLTKQECLDLLHASTVGRVGFSHPDGIKILPVNYLVVGEDVIIRTSPSGVIAALAKEGSEIAFEVDYHNTTGGNGWSVLLNGPITPLTDVEFDALDLPGRIVAWAGADRTLYLRFTARQVDGRRVQRRRHSDGS
jgi:uncharacterized protein